MASGRAFVADLPDMTGEQMEKLYAWGQSSCEQFDVHMQDGGAMTLVAVRKKSASQREHQRLLRTNLQNWGVSLPAKQTREKPLPTAIWPRPGEEERAIV